MSKRAFSVNQWTTGTGTTDTSANTTLQFNHLDPGSASQVIRIVEIFMGGLASASAVVPMVLRRDTTLATGAATALAVPNSDGPLNNFAAAVTTVPVAAISFATTMPTSGNSATLSRLNLTFNAFGGIVRWVAAPDEEWWMIGNAVNIASTMSTYTGGNSTTISSSIIYEFS